jgi:lipopolysaccharide export system protein LptC
MTIAPLPSPRPDRLASGSVRTRVVPTRRHLEGRRRLVLWTKRLLPVVALLLLSSVALWPEIAREIDLVRGNYSRDGLTAKWEAGKLLDVRYHGIDARNRPYTITADQATQATPERVNLVNPKGDLLSENGSWTFVQSQNGVYMQHAGLLDLSGDVVIYRDNGVTLRTAAAAMDLKAGAGASNQPTHAEGPFGTLDAQGFALVDKGASGCSLRRH